MRSSRTTRSAVGVGGSGSSIMPTAIVAAALVLMAEEGGGLFDWGLGWVLVEEGEKRGV